MYRITDHLWIDGLESYINAGSDELQVGEFVICSPQDLKANLVATNGEGVYFGGFICPYNILTRIPYSMKGEDTLTEVVKYRKILASLNMSEYEIISVYIVSIIALGLYGGKCSTNSDIGPLP